MPAIGVGAGVIDEWSIPGIGAGDGLVAEWFIPGIEDPAPACVEPCCIPAIASFIVAPRATVGVGNEGRNPRTGPPMFSMPIIVAISRHSSGLSTNDVLSRYLSAALRISARF